MTIFVRNDSDATIRLIYLAGCTVEVLPGEWHAVSMAGFQMQNEAANPNSQVARIDGEWRILLHMNVAACAHYDVTFVFTMDKKDTSPAAHNLYGTTSAASGMKERYAVLPSKKD